MMCLGGQGRCDERLRAAAEGLGLRPSSFAAVCGRVFFAMHGGGNLLRVWYTAGYSEGAAGYRRYAWQKNRRRQAGASRASRPTAANIAAERAALGGGKMARLWYGHFDSTPEDPRKLLASDWAAYIESFITSGIRSGGSNLRVIPSEEAMSVNIQPGAANLRGYIMQVREDLNGPNYRVRLPEAHPSMPRVDRVVLRLDRRIAARSVLPVVLMGVASHTPEAPGLTRTDNEVYELSLARVSVPAGARFLTSANITDERFDTELCGIINSVLGLDPSNWQDQFDEFFENFKADTAERDATFFSLQQGIFRENLDERNAEFNRARISIEDWYQLVKLDIARLQLFDFDNLPQLKGCVRITSFDSDGSITESIVRSSDNDHKVAQRLTSFGADGSVWVSVILFDSDGQTPYHEAVIKTTFGTNGDVLEEVI